MTTLVCYSVILFITFTPITQILVTLGHAFGAFIAFSVALVVWTGISHFWGLADGGVMPVVAYALALGATGLPLFSTLRELHEGFRLQEANERIYVEVIAIALVAGRQIYVADQIRWF